jgi:hypothetical protein
LAGCQKRTAVTGLTLRLALVLALVLCGTAQASLRSDSAALALKAWELPCASLQIDPLDPGTDPDILGEAELGSGSCEIQLAGRATFVDVGRRFQLSRMTHRERLFNHWYTAELICHTIVHEVGHLAGREHSTNPRSIMYPTPWRVLPLCARLAWASLEPWRGRITYQSLMKLSGP